MNKINNLICRLLLLSMSATVLTDVTPKVQFQVAEGGIIPQNSEDETHLGREHVTNTLNNTLSTTKNSNATQSVNKTSIIVSNDKSKDNGKTKPVIEKQLDVDAGVPKKNDEKQSVGKKGVSFTETDSPEYVPSKGTTSAMKTSSTQPPAVIKTKTSTTKEPIVKKPKVTVHDDLAPKDAPEKPAPDPKISNIDTLLEKKTRRANYVIPIVAVILSVPLVAIIISFLYKRGTDWWQHRNYRRMDFLIEGMYNN